MATGIVGKAFWGFGASVFDQNLVLAQGQIIFGPFRILTSLDVGVWRFFEKYRG